MAAFYDRMMRGSEEACLRQWRRELLADAAGRVLEIGAGTGACFPFYTDRVTHLVAAEPDPHMRLRMCGSSPTRAFEIETSPASADALPFASGSFDTVVSSLVLCSVENLEGAVAEIHRVLAPGGQLLFLEHVAADERPDRLRWQRRVEPIWKRIAGNCHLTRRTEAAIRDAGFDIERVTRESIQKAMPLARPSVRGRARKAPPVRAA